MGYQIGSDVVLGAGENIRRVSDTTDSPTHTRENDKTEREDRDIKDRWRAREKGPRARAREKEREKAAIYIERDTSVAQRQRDITEKNEEAVTSWILLG